MAAVLATSASSCIYQLICNFNRIITSSPSCGQVIQQREIIQGKWELAYMGRRDITVISLPLTD